MPRSLENLQFDNTYASLPELFYSRVQPTPFDKNDYLIDFNPDVAALLDIDPQQLANGKLLDYMSGKQSWPGSEPIAMLYAGHQFGHYVPQLGDGRAILLGEIRNANHKKFDLQVKGAGITPYSRQGDGRAVLRSTIREYLCSEAMHGLGIPTTRALCISGNDDEIYRENIETAALLLRVSPSHVRFGHFEVFFYREQHREIKTLADYVIRHHYPELQEHNNPYNVLLEEVIKRTARLMAQWQAVGFSHGVMNTDNMSILGLTIDYGPFGFMDAFQPGFICNHSDYSGRYAFDQQPHIGLWNLTCLAQALSPLIDIEAAKQYLGEYEQAFFYHYYDLMREKLGLSELDNEAVDIINQYLSLLQSDKRDYTNSIRALSGFKRNDANLPLRDQYISRLDFDKWAEKYNNRLNKENSDDRQRAIQMNQVNPLYVLRNYLA